MNVEILGTLFQPQMQSSLALQTVVTAVTWEGCVIRRLCHISAFAERDWVKPRKNPRLYCHMVMTVRKMFFLYSFLPISCIPQFLVCLYPLASVLSCIFPVPLQRCSLHEVCVVHRQMLKITFWYGNVCNTGLFKMIVGGFNNLPPRSPDATPCDFFLWGYVKDQVYVPPLPASTPELKVRIRTAIETVTTDMLQTVWNELDYRVDVCRITKGAHIEQL